MGRSVPSNGFAAIRKNITPASIPVSAKASVSQFQYASVVVLIAASCLAIELVAPAEWRPNMLWLLLAPAVGLFVTGIPALFASRRPPSADQSMREKDELIGLLLKDYAGERSDWLWASDIEGRLKGVSQKFAVHAARDAGALEGKPLVDVLAEGRSKDAGPDEIAIMMRQRQPFYNLEARIMTGGTECTWRMAGKPMFRNGRFDGYVGTAGNITSEFRARETMTFLAYYDGLTGLSNRVHFQKRLSECVARLDRYGNAFTLMYLDLDKFKAVNDTLGHQAGDSLLIEVAKRLSAQVRKADMVARLGGDEFALLLPDTSDPVNLANLATRLIQQLCKPFVIEGTELSIGVSVGIAIAPVNGSNAEELVRSADLALYRAKADGGNSYCFFEARMDAEAHEQRQMEIELGEALQRNELTFHYQPIVANVGGMVCGLEALIRWRHPTRGIVQPQDFVHLAERSGLIDRIGEWKIFEACRALARLPQNIRIAVNVAPKLFQNANVALIVEQALKATNVAAGRLEIEVTEDLLLDDPEGAAAASLADLKQLGVIVCLDHFGAGYASLFGLRKFAFDKLKIDRALIAAALDDADARATVKGIMALAQALGIAVACEGIMTTEQARFLEQAGSRALQGEFFASPMSFAQTVAAFGIEAAPAVERQRAAV